MDHNFHEEFNVTFLTLPTELLVYIISFLSSAYDKVKLTYVSSVQLKKHHHCGKGLCDLIMTVLKNTV